MVFNSLPNKIKDEETKIVFGNERSGLEYPLWRPMYQFIVTI